MCYDFISSITTKILLLSSCYILLLTTRNQPIIQEETIEGKEIVFLNYITFFFFPSRSSFRRQLHFLKATDQILWLKVLFAMSPAFRHGANLQLADQALFRLPRAPFLVVDPNAET